MRDLAEHAYFAVCRAAGRFLRSVRYATTRVHPDEVRKRRAFYAPLLVGLSDPLVRLLDAGVRVLPQRDWEERVRHIYRALHGASIGVDAGGTLVLPRLRGRTLATVLEDPHLEEPVRRTSIELAVVALAALHRSGFTHADAMAENVFVDLESGTAHWFDFETMHDPGRPLVWRRADDLRALLATCLLRTAREHLEGTLRLVLDAYADDEVARVMAASFTSAWRRPLALHLLQAPLSYGRFREIARLLDADRR